MMQKGKLYLIPSPLGGNDPAVIPAYVIELLHRMVYIVAERAKTARLFIKSTNPSRPISDYQVSELNEHTPPSALQDLLAPALEGHDLGLVSEAGCPGVADPGADLVALAHRQGIEVVPLVGPSSILLALMASGLNGQQFCFHGYLSPRPEDLSKDLKRLEQLSEKNLQTQIFIETPYRNKGVFGQALKTLSAETRFCVAADLTLPSQYIRTLKIAEWKKAPVPDLHKRPAIFLIGKSL